MLDFFLIVPTFTYFGEQIILHLKHALAYIDSGNKSVFVVGLKGYILQSLCIGFTSFRPETLPFVRQKMRDYQAVLLEEPQTPGFEEMLCSELSIEEYLQITDFEFPEYSHRLCIILQEFSRQGKTILQVDPYMDELLRIHEFFAAQGKPNQLSSGTITRQVYDCERSWTYRLLHFYRASVGKSFQEIVDSVKRFAQVDAQRGWLRNQMRADKISRLLKDLGSVYIEAGYIHVFLMRKLLDLLAGRVNLKVVYTMEPLLLSLADRRRMLAPGDILTLIYTFKTKSQRYPKDLLAAQSLIYNKVVNKEEMSDKDGLYPHTRDEIEAISLTRGLSFEQCKKLFFELKPLDTAQAKEYLRWWRGS